MAITKYIGTGAVSAADNEGVAIYMVQLSVNYTKIYEVI